MNITERELRWLTFEGYRDLFYSNVSKTKSMREAWQKTENEFQKTFLISRYKSYDSFRSRMRLERNKTLTVCRH